MVPKGLQANLLFRKSIIAEASKDKALAAAVKQLCAEDALFWINTFVWAYDPRNTQQPKMPFITYEFQDEAVGALQDAMGLGIGPPHDLVVEKSRDMGASWLCILAICHAWHFARYMSFMLVSRKEDLVVDTSNPDSLFWKLEFVLNHEPLWLRPPLRKKFKSMVNADTKSTIDGESTTENVGRGGRRTAFMLDEFASFADGFAALGSTADNSPCRIFNSTPNGVGNAFYARKLNAEEAGSPNNIIRMHWSRHPDKNKGLYTAQDGRLRVLDGDYAFKPDYPFILDGKTRSVWYDKECKRRGSDREIAEQLDIDYHGSGGIFFDAKVLDRIEQVDVRKPFAVGNLDYDPETAQPLGFTPNPDGPLQLWIHLAPDGKPPKDRHYVLGSDISTGSGASNSVTSVGDARSKEKVAELVVNNMSPETFAAYSVALARWFGGRREGGFMLWERHGPGSQFGARVVALGYRFMYYQTDEKRMRRKQTDIPGWSPTTESKMVLLGEYRAALATGKVVNRSAMSVVEARHYIYLPNGEVGFEGAGMQDDPSGARHNHGDRVIADALMTKGLSERETEAEKKVEIPYNCAAAIMERMRQRELEASRW